MVQKGYYGLWSRGSIAPREAVLYLNPARTHQGSPSKGYPGYWTARFLRRSPETKSAASPASIPNRLLRGIEAGLFPILRLPLWPR